MREVLTMLEEMYDRPVRESAIAHVALALVLDISASMSGDKINTLNKAVNDLISQMKSDSRLKDIVDLGVFVFGERGKHAVQQGFRAMADCSDMKLVADQRSTYVTEALDKAVDMLRARCNIYNSGGGSYKPWVILITDGEFHDSADELAKIGDRIKQREKENKLQFFGLGVDGFKRNQLELLTINPKHVLEVKAANFGEFLSWVGRSFAIISSKEIGATVTLEPLVFTV
jgi:uncharacterized protein YegL